MIIQETQSYCTDKQVQSSSSCCTPAAAAACNRLYFSVFFSTLIKISPICDVIFLFVCLYIQFVFFHPMLARGGKKRKIPDVIYLFLRRIRFLWRWGKNSISVDLSWK